MHIYQLVSHYNMAYIMITFLNVTANNISSYLLRIRIEYELYFSLYTFSSNPIIFDNSYPGKSDRSTTISLYNHYNNFDIIIDTKQTDLVHDMFDILTRGGNENEMEMDK